MVQPNHAQNQEPDEEETSRIRRLWKNTGIYALGDIAVRLTSGILTPLYTLLLLPEELGLWSLALVVVTGLSFLYNPALHGAVTRFFYDHEHDEIVRRRFQGTLASFLLVWSILLSAGLCLAGPWIFERFGLSFMPYGLMIIAIAVLTVLQIIPKAHWAASVKPKAFVGVNLLSSITDVFGGLLLVGALRLGVLGLFEARLGSLLVVSWLYLRHFRRHIGLAWHWPDFRKAILFSIPLVPHLAAHWILAMADRILLYQYLGLRAVGIYTAAYFFTQSINMVAVAMNRAWVPLFTRAYEQEGQRHFIARGITNFVVAVGSIAAMMAVLSPTIVRTFFSAKYQEAADICFYLSIGGFLYGLYYIYVSGLFYFKKNGMVPVITVVSGIVNLALNIHWIPTMGLKGAALATLVGYFVLTAGVWWACRRITRLPIERWRLGLFLMVASAVSAAAFSLDGLWSLGIEWLVKGALLLVAPVGLWAVGFWSKEELQTMRSKLPF